MAKIKCANCDIVFEPERTDEEALTEKEKLFPDVPLQDCVIVCDDCFQQLINNE